MVTNARFFPRIVFASIVTCTFSASAARADCADLLRQLDTAISSGSKIGTQQQLTDVQALDVKISKDGSCNNAEIIKAHRTKATVQFDLVKSMASLGKPVSDYEPLLVDASNVLWDAAAQLGNIKFTQKQYVAAVSAYERSLELVKDPSLTPIAPNAKTVKAIFDSASETRIIAANEEGNSSSAAYVVAAKDHRDGSVGGIFSEDLRAIKPTNVPLPINFETGSSRLTKIGQDAVNELVLALQQQQPKSITLVGHTDERGDASYNMRLSDERVKTVAGFLKQMGISTVITTVAKGKTSPIELTDASQFTREQIWALNRRVEFVRQ